MAIVIGRALVAAMLFAVVPSTAGAQFGQSFRLRCERLEAVSAGPAASTLPWYGDISCSGRTEPTPNCRIIVRSFFSITVDIQQSQVFDEQTQEWLGATITDSYIEYVKVWGVGDQLRSRINRRSGQYEQWSMSPPHQVWQGVDAAVCRRVESVPIPPRRF